jgi:hypothetical protein
MSLLSTENFSPQIRSKPNHMKQLAITMTNIIVLLATAVVPPRVLVVVVMMAQPQQLSSGGGVCHRLLLVLYDDGALTSSMGVHHRLRSAPLSQVVRLWRTHDYQPLLECTIDR